MNIDVSIVNAFVVDGRGGNPAGVVLDADRFSKEQKLEIAAQVGLSETAFVSHSDVADIKLEFFTPTRQIAHCGHATVATFSYLSQQGLLKNSESSKETIDGNRAVKLVSGAAFMEQIAPMFVSVNKDRQEILAALNIAETKLSSEPLIVNTGNSFLIAEVDSQGTLEQLNINQEKVEALSEKYDLIGFYIFSRESYTGSADATARMFAPRYGIEEESATGMAAGPLACYLYEKKAIDKSEFLIEQGYAMSPASPSQITVKLELHQGSIQSLMAGGHAAVSETRNLNVQ
ncbi:PhzF family phenazine biosynthesis protein [uncultured Pseudoteredinibacter sp.]|uniref:PhzF family phenazine biosynthesis protein n=1 Tax=uncultured Pseudoteredinibacter sp. TaxID=1641701 RepID=UPI002604C2F7|nr:PhzF family phenazine biosynthesis protein [uncultured Pseudoteredinibacter sp.]